MVGNWTLDANVKSFLRESGYEGQITFDMTFLNNGTWKAQVIVPGISSTAEGEYHLSGNTLTLITTSQDSIELKERQVEQFTLSDDKKFFIITKGDKSLKIVKQGK